MNNTNQPIPEEREWQIFELLEGNLDSKEAEKLLNEIKSNPSEWKFYQEMKCTYLVSHADSQSEEHVEFPHKESLNSITKNNKTVTIGMGIIRNKHFTNWSVAASIAIILGIGALVKLNQSTISVHPSSSTASSESSVHHSSSTDSSEPTQSTQINDKMGAPSLTSPLINHTLPIKNNTVQNRSTVFAPNQIRSKRQKMILAEKTSPEKTEKPNSILRPIEIVTQTTAKLQTNPLPKKLNTPQAEDFQNKAIMAANFNLESEIKVIYASDETENQFRNEEKALKRQWIKEAVQELKYGRLPEVRLSTRKQKNTWVPEIGINIASKSMVLHTTLVQK